jgi:hypothetical protein
MFFVQQPALMTLNKLLNYKQGYNIMNKIITLSIATIFLAWRPSWLNVGLTGHKCGGGHAKIIPPKFGSNWPSGF